MPQNMMQHEVLNNGWFVSTMPDLEIKKIFLCQNT